MSVSGSVRTWIVVIGTYQFRQGARHQLRFQGSKLACKQDISVCILQNETMVISLELFKQGNLFWEGKSNTEIKLSFEQTFNLVKSKKVFKSVTVVAMIQTYTAFTLTHLNQLYLKQLKFQPIK